MSYVVIKCGGSIVDQLPLSFYEELVAIQNEGKWKPVVVHGGGPSISKLLDQVGVPSAFVDGLRVTTEEVLEVVEMALSGSVNKQIVQQIVQTGGKAFGISGVDGGFLQAKPTTNNKKLGLVGDIQEVETGYIEYLTSLGLIPVVSPISMDLNGQKYNINADMAAAAIAQALQASLCFISDIDGIYQSEQTDIVHQASRKEILQMIEDKVIVGGMIPKVLSAIEAMEKGVPEVAIVNGLESNNLKQFLKGSAIGTRLYLGKEEMEYVEYNS
ncbi:acetylglutamate kinase [Radiobacillus kanasensis]|uniref:acetylglutamate kinase n=1 Tax=Radiobacillus kanasensis TaxID=2844358 RepID=UPI001E41768F|nr:acetylglutamate kinase [Radiobacillus kanasensis]UFT99123.1 acetylglutamate kinase [Radiobacillus kanasensis]